MNIQPALRRETFSTSRLLDFCSEREVIALGKLEFLLNRRVELNALASDQLVGFIERKLAEHGIRKVIPQADLLGDAYRLFVNSARLEKNLASRRRMPHAASLSRGATIAIAAKGRYSARCSTPPCNGSCMKSLRNA